MKGYRYYRINDELLELPYYEKGDRVSASGEVGTVERVEHDGLFVYVEWDDKNNGMGSRRLVSNIQKES